MKTILVVDDEWAIAEVLEALLADEGYRVIVANNGKQGLERLREWRPDLIMLDFMMPILDGPATFAALKADPATASIPVILMSSLPEETVAQRCAGYRSFLRKPFRIAAVLAAVDGALGRDP
ncbi:response regulator [Microvirga thermotolerans]|uniref:Response regulator n=1 Tax=Microvirga thermotolerans TaxID=2651334 RepID=A0A5P9JZL9_9HYPH|nr:response regulator [Microvirga thermotolerans]QFU17601.1 response regulator [Microvirga thermotolerans]